MNYEQALEYIHGINAHGSKLGLSRTRELLNRMGNPQDSLRFVHIAGTNGKGSTAQKRYLAEYKIFVEETILYDKQYRILISIMRDVTDREEMRKSDLELRRQTAEITDKAVSYTHLTLPTNSRV